MEFTKSNCPFNYAGSKSTYSFLHNVDCNIVDLFAGGGGFYSNTNSNRIIVNDINEHLINFQEQIYNATDDEYLELKKLIYEETDKVNSREEYEDLRFRFNLYKNSFLFYCCLCCCTNNLIRFNKKGGFNQTWGKRKFNSSMEAKLDSFRNRIKNKKIQFNIGSYLNIPTYDNAIYFCDSPYLITSAGYNTEWNENDDKELYKYLEDKKFGMTNYLTRGELTNHILAKAIEDNNWTVITIREGKMKAQKDDSYINEVLICDSIETQNKFINNE